MWQFNAENWERRKSHLIRSLFHDIPLLSPVPETREPSYSPPRPASPLPPLIIERMPNRHDEPIEYYRELEVKMKKVYRKLFYNETSSSVDSILAQYDADTAMFLVADDYLDKNAVACTADSSDKDLGAFTLAVEDKSDSDSSSLNQHQSESDASSNNALADQNISNSFLDAPLEDHKSISSTLDATQVTTQVEIHEPPPNLEDVATKLNENNPSSVYDDVETPASPLLGSQLLLGKKTYDAEVSDEESRGSDVSRDVECEENSEQELVSRSEKRQEVSSEANESSTTSIEAMRRQKTLGFRSLGSIQHSDNDKSDDTLNKTIDFIRRTISEVHSDYHNDEMFEAGEKAISLQYDDFASITYTSSPIMNENNEFGGNKRSFEEACSGVEFVTKRVKAKDTGTQTLFIDAHKDCDWNILKKNFFVGTPMMFKLCACDDHTCSNDK